MPAPPTPLIGRDDDVAALVAALRGAAAAAPARLVTLTGPGGVGKTRLALAVAADVAAWFPDGVAFAPSPRWTIPRSSSRRSWRRSGCARPAAGRHARAARPSRGQHLLLVLDNCEHLLDAAPDIADLLADCPGLAILATSRAPLRLRGEREWPVAPLAPPELARLPTAGEIAGNPAVRLFVERAREVAPGFALAQANAAAVAAICRRLDGLPLAIELAAARVRLLSPTEVLARLDRALPLLAGGGRDLPARQRTMRDAIAWSYDLLDPAGQALFRRLSVFAGGWELAAAEAVGAPVGDVLGPLAGLVEQSLVVAVAEAGGGTRYRLLEPVGEYARERLEEGGEAEGARRRHAEYYLALAERAGPELAGPAQVAWLARLDREQDNVRAAMAWALAAPRLDIAARLGWALHIFWAMRGHHREGRRWLEAALARGGLPPAEEARAVAAVGLLARMEGDYETAMTHLGRALALFREQRDTPSILATLSRLGHAARLRGDYRRARTLAEEGLALAREVGDRARVVWMLDVLGLVALAEGDYARAAAVFAEALPLAEAEGDGRYLAGLQANLGAAALGQGRHAEAGARSRVGLELSAGLGLRRGVAINLDTLASVAAAAGQPGRAARLYGAAEALREAEGLAPWSPADRALHEPHLRPLRARLGEAAFTAAWAEGRALGLEGAVALALSPAASEAAAGNGS